MSDRELLTECLDVLTHDAAQRNFAGGVRMSQLAIKLRAHLAAPSEDIEALRRDAERLTDEQIDSATAKERDALLDHIYEYGTAAEGILERIRKLARAAIDAAMEPAIEPATEPAIRSTGEVPR